MINVLHILRYSRLLTQVVNVHQLSLSLLAVTLLFYEVFSFTQRCCLATTDLHSSPFQYKPPPLLMFLHLFPNLGPWRFQSNLLYQSVHQHNKQERAQSCFFYFFFYFFFILHGPITILNSPFTPTICYHCFTSLINLNTLLSPLPRLPSGLERYNPGPSDLLCSALEAS